MQRKPQALALTTPGGAMGGRGGRRLSHSCNKCSVLLGMMRERNYPEARAKKGVGGWGGEKGVCVQPGPHTSP